MILGLVKQNPAVRTLPRWLVLALVNATFLVGVIAFASSRYGEIHLNTLLSVVWIILALYLVFGDVRAWCSPFQMALPIPSRTLWLSHVLAVIIAGITIVAVAAGIAAGGIWLLWMVTDKWFVFPAELGKVAVLLFSGLLLAVAVLQDPRASLLDTRRSTGNVAFSLGVMVAVLALLTLSRAHLLAAAVMPVAAVIIGFVRYRAVPEMFRLVPAAPAEAERGSERRADTAISGYAPRAWGDAVGARSGAGFGWFVTLTIYRSFSVGAKRKHTPWVTVPFLILFGALLSRLTDLWMSEGMRFAYIPMAAYLLLSFIGAPIAGMRMLDPLPIPRRRLFAVVVVPALVLLSIGHGMGTIAASMIERGGARSDELIRYVRDEEDGRYYNRVPVGFCKIAWGGEPPANRSPWGESRAAWRTPLHKGSFIKLYSPFSTPPGSSLEFVALQISRATEAVYGRAIPPEEIADRYLEPETDGATVRLKGAALTLQRDFPELRPRGKGAAFPVILLLVALLWFLLMDVYLRTLRAGVPQRVRAVVFWCLMAFVLSLWVFHVVAAMTGFMEIWVSAGFMEILIRQLTNSLPGGAAAVWALCALLLAGAYRMVARRFERAELGSASGCC